MNTIAANEMMSNELISAKAKAIYQYLAYRSNKAHKCFPALKTIARECSMSVSTVQRGLRELLEGGFIRKKHNYRPNGSQTSNIYELVVAVAERVEAASKNMQQRFCDAEKKLEQMRENKRQTTINLPAAAAKKVTNSEKETVWSFLNRLKFRHLTKGGIQNDHPTTSIV